MSLDLLALQVQNHSRQLLATLRQNPRFSLPSSVGHYPSQSSFSSSAKAGTSGPGKASSLSASLSASHISSSSHNNASGFSVSSPHSFVFHLQSIREKISAQIRQYPVTVDVPQLFAPFLQMVQSTEATADLTASALQAIIKLLGYIERVYELDLLVMNHQDSQHDHAIHLNFPDLNPYHTSYNNTRSTTPKPSPAAPPDSDLSTPRPQDDASNALMIRNPSCQSKSSNSKALVATSEALAEIIDAVAECKFNSVDREFDQLVYAHIIQVFQHCINLGWGVLHHFNSFSQQPTPPHQNDPLLTLFSPKSLPLPSVTSNKSSTKDSDQQTSESQASLNTLSLQAASLDLNPSSNSDKKETLLPISPEQKLVYEKNLVTVSEDLTKPLSLDDSYFTLDYDQSNYYHHSKRSSMMGVSDASLMKALITCFRIINMSQHSDLLMHLAMDSLFNITGVISRNICAVAKQKSWSNVQELAYNQLSFDIFEHIKRYGLYRIPLTDIKVSTEQPGTTNALLTILLLASHTVDPRNQRPEQERMLALSILIAALSESPLSGSSNLMNIPIIRRVLLREVSRSLLRSLGMFDVDSPQIISACFSVVLTLLQVTGPYGGMLLCSLLQRVFPAYVYGTPRATEKNTDMLKGRPTMSSECREMGLEALGALLAQPGLLSVAYSSIDCNLKVADSVEPLLRALGHVTCTVFKKPDSKPGSHNEYKTYGSEEDDDDDVVESKQLERSAALVCAGILMNAIESISDRLKHPNNAPLHSSIPTAHLKIETVEHIRDKKNRKLKMLHAVEAFNKREGKGGAPKVLEIINKEQDIPNDQSNESSDPADGMSDSQVKTVVNFLRETPNLNKTAIGTILGEPDPASQKVLTAYTATFDFKGQPFTSALRIFLESFRLPGEAQKIDRIVNAFAKAYFEANQRRGDEGDVNPTTANVTGTLASPDAAYVLAFAVVMLNTDQHNTSIKKRMSFEDFVRNNRGINDGKSLPLEFLQDIFDSINSLEIKMSDESGIKDLTDVHWDESLKLSGVLHEFDGSEESALKEKDSLLIIYPEDIKVLDREVFNLTWRSAIEATTVAFEESTEPNAAQKALEGFLSIARCSTSFRLSEATDDCVVRLCNATAIIHGPLVGATLRFGTSIKAQMAAVALLGLARQCADWMRSKGWESLMAVVLRLHVLGLLPVSMEKAIGGYGSDLVDPDGRNLPMSTLIPSWWPSVTNDTPQNTVSTKKKESMFFKNKGKSNGFFSNLFGSVSSLNEHLEEEKEKSPSFLRVNTQEESEARNLSKKCVLDCRVDEILIYDTKFLRTESLKCVIEVITNLIAEYIKSERSLKNVTAENVINSESETKTRGDDVYTKITPSNGVVLNSTEDSKVKECMICFCVDLLTELTIRNRDRLGLVWPQVRDIINEILKWAQEPCALVERAVVAIFRIAVRLFHREEIQTDILNTINVLVELPENSIAPISIIISSGVYHILKLHSQYITSDWPAILTLIETCGKQKGIASTIGYECLRFLILKKSMIMVNAETFIPFLNTVQTYAKSGGVTSSTAIDFLYELSRKIPDIGPNESKSDFLHVDAPSSHWSLYWAPLLQVISNLCRDPRGEIRNHALLVLESLIATGGGDRDMDSIDWKIVFGTVIFPLINDILSIDNNFLFEELNSLQESIQSLKGPGAIQNTIERNEQIQDIVFAAKKTRLRSIVILSKTFLQHHAEIASTASSEEFTELMETVLSTFHNVYDQSQNSYGDKFTPEINNVINTTDDLLGEHVLESVKNILLVMKANELLTPNNQPLWDKTVEAIKTWLPAYEQIMGNE